MKIYHYHQITGEYLGEGIADESPLEKGVYHIPANATNQEPPEIINANKLLIYQNNIWQEAEIPTTPEEIPKVLTEEEIKENQKQSIKQELSRLDLIIPRIVEDILSQSTNLGIPTFTIHQSKLDIITQKELLREQLRELEG